MAMYVKGFVTLARSVGVGWRNENAIALSWTPVSCGHHQPGRTLVFSLPAQPARHRRTPVRARRRGELRNDRKRSIIGVYPTAL